LYDWIGALPLIDKSFLLPFFKKEDFFLGFAF